MSSDENYWRFSIKSDKNFMMVEVNPHETTRSVVERIKKLTTEQKLFQQTLFWETDKHFLLLDDSSVISSFSGIKNGMELLYKDRNFKGTKNKPTRKAIGIARKWTKTELDATKEIFQILTEDYPDLLSHLIGQDVSSPLCLSLINFSLATGTTFPMIKFFLDEEFRAHAEDDPGSIMRGNCLASRMTKEYLQIVGGTYLNDILVPFIKQLNSEGRSMEIDPMKMTNTDDLDTNKNELSEKIKQLIQSLVHQDSIEKMPMEIRVIASYFAELANNYVPEQFFKLIGGFLLLRYISPALSNPDVYGLVKENSLSTVTRRNLILLTKALQNLSNGVEFGKKEPYMMVLNDFINANLWKLEKYFKDIVSKAEVPQKVIDNNAVSDADMSFLHALFFHNREKIVDDFPEEDPTREKLSDLLRKLEEYRHLDYLEKKTQNDVPSTVRVIVETPYGVYEHAVDGPLSSLNPIISSLSSTMKKHDGKEKKGINFTRKKDSPRDTVIFGKPLEQIMEYQKSVKPDLRVPDFLHDIFNIILLKGLHISHLFMVSRNTKLGVRVSVELLRQEIDKGEKVNFNKVDVHELCELVKLYLRKLPEPLLTNKLYPQFIRVSSQGQENMVEEIKSLISTLPKSNRDLIEAILQVLWMIHRNSNINFMDSSNLSLVMTPLLLNNPQISSKSGNSSLAAETKLANTAIQVMIEEYEYLFQESILQAEKKPFPVWKYRLVGHKAGIKIMTYVPHEKVATSSATIIRLWDLERAVFLKQIDNESGFGHILSMLAPDEHSLFVCSEKAIRIWDPTTGSLKSSIITNGASSMVFIRDQLWTNSLLNKSVYIYDKQTLDIMDSFETPKEGLYQLFLLGKELWTGGFNGTIFVFDVQTRKVISQLSGHTKKVNTLERVESTVWSGSADGLICIWNQETKEMIRKIDIHSGKIQYLRMWHDKVWCCTFDMSVKIFSTNGEILYELKNHTDAVSGILFHHDSKQKKWFCWTSSYDNSISIWLIPQLDPDTEINKRPVWRASMPGRKAFSMTERKLFQEKSAPRFYERKSSEPEMQQETGPIQQLPPIAIQQPEERDEPEEKKPPSIENEVEAEENTTGQVIKIEISEELSLYSRQCKQVIITSIKTLFDSELKLSSLIDIFREMGRIVKSMATLIDEESSIQLVERVKRLLQKGKQIRDSDEITDEDKRDIISILEETWNVMKQAGLDESDALGELFRVLREDDES